MVDGGFRRVEVLGPRLLVRRERAPGEGDDLALLIADGKHDPVAELRVEHRGLRLAVCLRGLTLPSLRSTPGRRHCSREAACENNPDSRNTSSIGHLPGRHLAAGSRIPAHSRCGSARSPRSSKPAALEVFASVRRFRTLQPLLEKAASRLVQIEQGSAQFGLASLSRAVELHLRHGHAQLLRQQPHGFGKGDVLDALQELVDVAGLTAAETMKELARSVYGERRRFLAMERAQSGVILRARALQANVLA